MIALLFPGQGAHRAGMAAAWEGHPAHATFDEVGRATGMDLARLADDPDACAETAVAQPAVYAASIAAWRALTDRGVDADVVAGHSLGEITAAVAAGCLSVTDGARLVGERGKAMARACQSSPGGMTAVLGLDDAAVASLRRWLDGPGRDVVLANDNAPGQIVLAGPDDALERAGEQAGAAGGRLRSLPVEGAFHSPAMTPAMVAVDQATRRLDFTDPRVTFLRGRDGEAVTDGESAARALTEGVLAPVRWRAVQDALARHGVTHAFEVGPGRVLRGLARRTIPDVEVQTVDGADAATGVELTTIDIANEEVPAWA